MPTKPSSGTLVVLNMNSIITQDSDVLDAMFLSGTHYGVAKSRRHPSVKNVLYGQKQKVDIFDVVKTKTYLDTAKSFVQQLGRERKLLLFVGGKPESHKVMRESALRVGAPYVIGRWVGGSITNYSEIKKRIAHMQDLIARRESGSLAQYTKFERLQIDREIEKLETMFAGLVFLNDKLPHALFVIDPKREAIAVREAQQNHIPVIALANSDCDISDITYPIPANDSALKSISYFVTEIADAYRAGLEEALTPAVEKSA